MLEFGREPMLSTLGLVCRYAVSDGIPKRSFYVAIVVGTVLNLINQGEVLFGASPIKRAITHAQTGARSESANCMNLLWMYSIGPTSRWMIRIRSEPSLQSAFRPRRQPSCDRRWQWAQAGRRPISPAMFNHFRNDLASF